MAEHLMLRQGVFLFHGTLANDLAYLLKTVELEGSRVATRSEVKMGLPASKRRSSLQAHASPVWNAALRWASRGEPSKCWTQAYVEARPHKDRNEAGSPHARYAVVDR